MNSFYILVSGPPLESAAVRFFLTRQAGQGEAGIFIHITYNHCAGRVEPPGFFKVSRNKKSRSVKRL